MSGHAVIDSTGRVIGEVVGQVLDIESWHVAALRVKLSSALAAEWTEASRSRRGGSRRACDPYGQNSSQPYPGRDRSRHRP